MNSTEGKKPEKRDDRYIEIAEKVGSISYKMLNFARERIKEGVKLLDVAEATEKYARNEGYELAFPVNISINEYAAHYTPSAHDEKTFKTGDIVKVDLGAKEGDVFGDCAITINLSNENQKLVEASKEALDNAISIIKTGVKLADIGRVIDETIKKKGFIPIKNLGGHGVELRNLHAEPFIPNYDNKDQTTLKEGMIIALEPFATNGKGYVVNSDIFEIYRYISDTQIRNPNARKLLSEIKSKHQNTAFAVRWFSNLFESEFSLYSAVRELLRAGAIEVYPTLVESGKGLVSQAEVEVLVEKDSCKVLTK